MLNTKKNNKKLLNNFKKTVVKPIVELIRYLKRLLFFTNE